MVQMLVAGTGAYYRSQWLGVGLALILGTMATLASLVLGQHVALGFLRWSETRSNKNKLRMKKWNLKTRVKLHLLSPLQ